MGDDVHALFFKEAGAEVATADPTAAVSQFLKECDTQGKWMNPAYAEALKCFSELVESRKPGMDGNWLNNNFLT